MRILKILVIHKQKKICKHKLNTNRFDLEIISAPVYPKNITGDKLFILGEHYNHLSHLILKDHTKKKCYYVWKVWRKQKYNSSSI